MKVRTAYACLFAVATVGVPHFGGADLDWERKGAGRSLAESRSEPDTSTCKFGTTPGSWVREQWPQHIGKGSDQHTYSRLDDSEQSIWLNSYKDDGGVPFGSARVSIDPDCPLENLVLPYLTGGKGLPEPVTILWVGDSLDAQLLDYVCIDYVRRGGSSGWFAFLRNHIQVNYCHLPNGLTLVQKYAKRDNRGDDEETLRIVRAFFNGDDSNAVHNRRNEEPVDNYVNRTWEVPILTEREPDLVVFGGTFWPLHNYVGEHKGEEMLPLLPIAQVQRFAQESEIMIKQLQKDFPKSTIVARNSPEITTNCDTGSHIAERRRTWGLRTYVDQLNNAIVRAARAAGADLVDMKSFADSWQPRQLTTDGVHPNCWFQMELLNVYLNMVKALRKQKAAGGAGAGGRK